MTPIFRGKVEKGKALPADPVRFASHLRRLEGADVEIIVRKHRKKRSDPQNKYYWGVVVAILADHCGYDKPEEMHDALRIKFLTIHQDGPLPTVRSTADLSTVEFEHYMLQCRKLGAEMNCQIPEPNEVEYA